MGRLVYLMNVSLDGYIETPDGSLDWARVDSELHSWFGEQARGNDAFLYGRRLYETMSAAWPMAGEVPGAEDHIVEYARIWDATPKIVFSRTLDAVTGNARLERGDPAEALERIRGEFPGELSVGGPTLAGEFVRRGLVDEYRLVVHPAVLGAGKKFFPDDTPLDLDLAETRQFGCGAAYLRYVSADARA